MSASAADTAKKARTSLDTDMEISAVETLIDAKFKVDIALNSANTTLLRTPSEPGGESEAVAKASQTTKLKDEGVYAEAGSQSDQWQVGAETTG